MTDEALIREAWPDWTVTEMIGKGACSTVYAVSRRDLPEVEAAVKVIPVPANEGEPAVLRSDGFTDEEIADYFRKETEELTSEIRMMKKYQGMSHFVSMEDCKVIDHPDEALGSWILIRMEKLKSLPSYFCDKTLSEREVADLGIQLCTALSVCHADHIIHRDIKPGNIFVNDRSASGVLYKLGDFGVSRRIENISASFSIKGALGYMAPEIIQGLPYDERADIYSLGLTLYKLMNGNRFPFMPDRRLFTREDHALAQRERMSGAAFPDASDASPALNQVLRKACAFEPDDRYPSAEAFSSALSHAMEESSEKITDSDTYPSEKQQRVGKTLRWIIPACTALALLLFLSLAVAPSLLNSSPPAPAATEVPMLAVADRRVRTSAVGKALADLYSQWELALAAGDSQPESLIETLPLRAFLDLAPKLVFDAESQSVRIPGSDDSWLVLLIDESNRCFECTWDQNQESFILRNVDGIRPDRIQSVGVRFRLLASSRYIQAQYLYSADPVPVLTRLEIQLEKGSGSLPCFFSAVSVAESGSHCVLYVTSPNFPTQTAETDWPERRESP